MKSYAVVWHPRAERDLLALYDWIALRAGADTAFAYTRKIEATAASLAQYPERGTPRDDLVRGLRTVPYRRRTIIGYRVVDGRVEVLRLVHGGQEWDGSEDGEG